MFAGGGCVAGGCIPAKPQWSKVLIFLAFSSDRESARRSKVSGVVSSYIHLCLRRVRGIYVMSAHFVALL